ncbi:hypothetical protein [Wolbachia endosymbiont (group A) of Agelastica alni]
MIFTGVLVNQVAIAVCLTLGSSFSYNFIYVNFAAKMMLCK